MGTGSSAVSNLPAGYTLEGQGQPAAAPTQAPSGMPAGYQLEGSQAAQQAGNPGTQTNDVGNTIIVPKEGESFSDTMARVREAGSKVTQQQIDKEMAPKKIVPKVATTLAAAPVIGAGGSALLAGAGELGEAGSRLLNGGQDPLLEQAESKVSQVGRSVVDKAKAVAEWAKGNPIKATAIEAIAHEVGVDPFQLMHTTVKYGKHLFGSEEAK